MSVVQQTRNLYRCRLTDLRSWYALRLCKNYRSVVESWRNSGVIGHGTGALFQCSFLAHFGYDLNCNAVDDVCIFHMDWGLLWRHLEKYVDFSCRCAEKGEFLKTWKVELIRLDWWEVGITVPKFFLSKWTKIGPFWAEFGEISCAISFRPKINNLTN